MVGLITTAVGSICSWLMTNKLDALLRWSVAVATTGFGDFNVPTAICLHDEMFSFLNTHKEKSCVNLQFHRLCYFDFM